MKVSDFRLRMDFRYSSDSSAAMIHELGSVNQQHLAENGHGTKVLKVRTGRVKSLCGNSFIQHICTSTNNHGNQFLAGSLKL